MLNKVQFNSIYFSQNRGSCGVKRVALCKPFKLRRFESELSAPPLKRLAVNAESYLDFFRFYLLI